MSVNFSQIDYRCLHVINQGKSLFRIHRDGQIPRKMVSGAQADYGKADLLPSEIASCCTDRSVPATNDEKAAAAADQAVDLQLYLFWVHDRQVSRINTFFQSCSHYVQAFFRLFRRQISGLPVDDRSDFLHALLSG